MRLNVKPYENLNLYYCLKIVNFNVYEKYFYDLTKKFI